MTARCEILRNCKKIHSYLQNSNMTAKQGIPSGLYIWKNKYKYVSGDFSSCFSNVVSDFLMNKINGFLRSSDTLKT